MCAINGFNFEDTKLIKQMNMVTRHRGPDGTGIFVQDGISLGHNRLSIIDLSKAANQPMYSSDKKLVVVFNGEIYNFRELRKELENSYKFSTKSDTEVILASYQRWGTECVKKFNGIFAFAIWDTQTRELFLARDHIGVKPLYYFWDGVRLIFSSEIKALLEHDIPRTVDTESLNHYLRIQYTPGPQTMFKGVQKLPAGHYATLRNKELSMHLYWNARPKPVSRGKQEEEQLVRSGIYEAVERQLVSDRPVGLYLSGGIDSSAVLHAMSQAHKNVETFSVGFDLSKEEQSEKFNADFELARRTAAHYGTKHHEVLVSSDDVVSLFEQAVWHLDEPISNPTEIAMLKLSQATKDKVAVVLGGDGGDELFGGYERYRLSYAASMYQKYIPNFLRRAAAVTPRLQKLNIPPTVDRFELFMFQKDAVIAPIVQPSVFMQNATKRFFAENYFSNVDTATFESHLMDVDRRTWLIDESLMRSDKMGMAHGLEVRVPLLDRELVDLAATIPQSSKVSFFDTKAIMRNALKNELPAFLFSQPKRGWFSPGAKWLRHPHMTAFAQEVFSPEYYDGSKDLFDWDAVDKMLDDHVSKRNYNLTLLWELLTFQLWARRFKISV